MIFCPASRIGSTNYLTTESILSLKASIKDTCQAVYLHKTFSLPRLVLCCTYLCSDWTVRRKTRNT